MVFEHLKNFLLWLLYIKYFFVLWLILRFSLYLWFSVVCLQWPHMWFSMHLFILRFSELFGFLSWYWSTYLRTLGFPDSSDSTESAGNAGDLSSIPGSGKSLEKDRQPTPVFLPGKFHGLEDPGKLQSMWSQRANMAKRLTLENFGPIILTVFLALFSVSSSYGTKITPL